MEVEAIVQLTAIILGVLVVIWHKQHTTNQLCAELKAEFNKAIDRFRDDVNSPRAEVASLGQTKCGGGET